MHACVTKGSAWTIFYTLREAQIVVESWRRHYNAVRPRMPPLGYRPPAPEVFVHIRVAGYAPTGSAGHAGVTASSKLTFRLDHPMQAGHNSTLNSSPACTPCISIVPFKITGLGKG